jgi:hypothetical protein
MKQLASEEMECALMQVNELAFTQDGKLFLQATDSGIEVPH